jgi:hypothetical protein
MHLVCLSARAEGVAWSAASRNHLAILVASASQAFPAIEHSALKKYSKPRVSAR